MSGDPLLTIDELATVLRVSTDMTREWESQGVLQAEADAQENKKYRQRHVVAALREHPEIMTAVKQAMMAKRGIFNEPPEGSGTSAS